MDVVLHKKRTLFILNFHGIGKPTRTLAPGEAEYWIDTPLFAGLLDLVNGRDDVRVTLDDANESDYTIALPMLKARKIQARFFVVAARLNRHGFLSCEQVRALCAEGMLIGNHGMNHRRWPPLGERELEEELSEARDRIEQVCGTAVTEAACPFGAYTRKVLQRLQAEKYQKIYTSDGGPAVADSWIHPRNTMIRGDSPESVWKLISTPPSLPNCAWRRFKQALKQWR